MPRVATGSKPEWNEALQRWTTRLRYRGGVRRRETLPAEITTERQARQLVRTWAAEARTMDPPTRAQPTRATGGETFSAWAARWFTAREAAGMSVRSERSKCKTHLESRLGARAMADITPDEIEDLRDELDAKIRAETIAWKTAAGAWGMLGKMFDDARNAKDRAFRLRRDDPTAGIKPPDRGVRKSKQFLYPAEFLRLVSCPALPLAIRRLYAGAVYLYTRAGELEALEWSDLDLEQGAVHVHRAIDYDTGEVDTTKEAEDRSFKLEPALLPMLRAMYAARGTEARVFAPFPASKVLAVMLREHLKTAGVTRERLFVTDRTRKNLTFHDLRATGITWMAVRGDSSLVIERRVGHSDPQSTRLYVREAEAIGDAFGTPFPALPAELIGSLSGQHGEVKLRKYRAVAAIGSARRGT